MRYLATLLTLFVLACGGGQVRLDAPSADEITYHVVGLVDNDGHAFCSGVLIPGGVLTAAHCVRDREDVAIGLRWDLREEEEDEYWFRSYRVPVVSVDVERDLAFLRYDHDTAPRAILGAENPHLGDAIFAVGHPLGIPYVVHQGHVSGFPRHHFVEDFMLTDAGLIGGMSGGGVFGTQGQLLGLISFTICESPFSCSGTLGGFVPVESIHAFLREIPQ